MNTKKQYTATPQPQPGPTPETDACTKKAGSESVMEDAHAYRKLCASLEHERDEARRERDALGQAFDKLREQVVTAEATNATLRNEVKINVKNGLELHTQLTALRQDRDGLAALCELRKEALLSAQERITELSVWCKLPDEGQTQDEITSALALTPAEALARQRDRKQEDMT